ncbi:hypothetical protein B0T26DRAFT_753064 [Lasiosphaeria miniovina]|uniref:Uncharacterized protein n=1 Tax=Lasiosphaeria miniovina TaxID=1954250 RepID=A0AA40ABK7_9PEZI|nr:uncharacterized protein B0T26DRAFT_753064 [Lasiosphaeria miniovina]KAK0712887.1 hypothetical protein B0T26DRAFT_753064 [Lasiosphaeria miniovina]
MADRSAAHTLQFGIELELTLRPTEQGLQLLQTFEFKHSDEAYASDVLGGARGANRDIICDFLRTYFDQYEVPVNRDDDIDHDKWTIGEDPTIREQVARGVLLFQDAISFILPPPHEADVYSRPASLPDSLLNHVDQLDDMTELIDTMMPTAAPTQDLDAIWDWKYVAWNFLSIHRLARARPPRRPYKTNAVAAAAGQTKPWERFATYVDALNARNPTGTISYKVLYSTHYGIGIYNATKARIGTAAWDGDGVVTWADAKLIPKGVAQAADLARFWAAGIAEDVLGRQRWQESVSQKQTIIYV